MRAAVGRCESTSVVERSICRLLGRHFFATVLKFIEVCPIERFGTGRAFVGLRTRPQAAHRIQTP